MITESRSKHELKNLLRTLKKTNDFAFTPGLNSSASVTGPKKNAADTNRDG